MTETETNITSVKGMPDVLPTQIAVWQHVEKVIRKLLDVYAYTEVRMPLLERTQLFKRSIGEVTDIVEKEMFSFQDQNGDSLTLRPEGTAGCVRACMEYALLRNQQQQKLWYMGPMFRYEKPQKGRYRQFTQLGVEAFNMPGPDIDVEQLALCARLWKELKVDHLVSLQINSLGDLNSRNTYKQTLIEYFTAHQTHLDEDSKRRLSSNPLRILDSKNPDMQELIARAPILLDFLDADSEQHFAELQRLLTLVGIKYTVNPRIVRGLDYYNRTVFEWTSDKLGSQSAVCAGGRYDSLVSMLGGQQPTPAVGFAMGLERLILLLEAAQQEHAAAVDGYLLCVGDKAEAQRLVIAERLRDILPGFALATHFGGGSLGNLFKKADKSGAKVAFIIGDDEIANQTVGIKFLRIEGTQQTVPFSQIQQVIGDI